jgi:hypothetical protein
MVMMLDKLEEIKAFNDNLRNIMTYDKLTEIRILSLLERARATLGLMQQLGAILPRPEPGKEAHACME